MARGYDDDYNRDYARPRQVPPEPMGDWGLSHRSERWAKDENRWGTSRQERDLDPGRGRPRGGYGSDYRGSEWRPGGNWGSGGRPRSGGWNVRQRESGRERGSNRDWSGWPGDTPYRGGSPYRSSWRGSPGEGWGTSGRGRGDRGRGPESADRQYDWSGWGEQGRPRDYDDWSNWAWQGSGGGSGAWDYGRAGYPRRTLSDEWGQYGWRGDLQGAWSYGRQRRAMLGQDGWTVGERHVGRGRAGGARPESREGGRDWNEVSPGRWTRERRPDERPRSGRSRSWRSDSGDW